jgi:hypothetical protein
MGGGFGGTHTHTHVHTHVHTHTHTHTHTHLEVFKHVGSFRAASKGEETAHLVRVETIQELLPAPSRILVHKYLSQVSTYVSWQSQYSTPVFQPSQSAHAPTYVGQVGTELYCGHVSILRCSIVLLVYLLGHSILRHRTSSPCVPTWPQYTSAQNYTAKSAPNYTVDN